MAELFQVFFNVILPVFGIVLLGALLGKKLDLEAKTLTRIAYYVFVPAFIFRSISMAEVPLTSVSRMLTFIIVTHLLAVVAAGILGWMMGKSKQMIAAFIMIASFGNVGNFGLAIIQFRLGDIALPAATIYFVAINTVAFIVCIGVAGWAHGGSRGAVWNPLLLDRMIGLLAGAMIPVMLFALGLQLLEQGKIHLTRDVFTASSLRLILVPGLALLVAIPFGLPQIENTAGVLQAAMPVAILVSIIAKENDIVPEFVTSVVVVSTLVSVVTLSVLMVFL